VTSTPTHIRGLTIDDQIPPMLAGRYAIALVYVAAIVLLVLSDANLRPPRWRWFAVAVFPVVDLILNMFWHLSHRRYRGRPEDGIRPCLIPHARFDPAYFLMRGFGTCVFRCAGIFLRPHDETRGRSRVRTCLGQLADRVFLREHHCPSAPPPCTAEAGKCAHPIIRDGRVRDETFCPWPLEDEWDRTVTVNRQREIASHFAWDFLLMAGTLLFLPNPRNLVFAAVFVLIVSIAGGNLCISQRHWFKTPISFISLWAWFLFGIAWCGGQAWLNADQFSWNVAFVVILITGLTFVFCDYLASFSRIRLLQWLKHNRGEQERQNEAERARTLAVAAYKIGHPMKHRVGPVGRELRWFLDCARVGPIPPDLALGHACSALLAWGRVEALGHVLDALSRAVGSHDKDKGSVFQLPGKEEWRDAFPYDISGQLVRLADEVNGSEPCKIGIEAEDSLASHARIEPWIQGKHGECRPSDIFYDELFTELLTNASRGSPRKGGGPTVVRWTLENIFDPVLDESRPGLVLSNPCVVQTARSGIHIESEEWEPWNKSEGAAVGGVLFLAHLLESTGMGRLFVRIKSLQDEEGMFSVGLWLSGLEKGDEKKNKEDDHG